MTTLPPDRDPVDAAWRIHSAHIDWTGKVDTKANFVLVIESAMFAGVLRLNPTLLHTKPSQWAFALGVVALVVALVLVLLVVAPRLRTSELKDEAADNFVYFGHLKGWTADELEGALKERDVLPVLSRQIVSMADIAWTKHRRLQASVCGAFVAAFAFGLSALFK